MFRSSQPKRSVLQNKICVFSSSLFLGVDYDGPARIHRYMYLLHVLPSTVLRRGGEMIWEVGVEACMAVVIGYDR